MKKHIWPIAMVSVQSALWSFAGDQIKHIWAVRNPEKLRPWTTG